MEYQRERFSGQAVGEPGGTAEISGGPVLLSGDDLSAVGGNLCFAGTGYPPRVVSDSGSGESKDGYWICVILCSPRVYFLVCGEIYQ